jgi:Tfp pilus assembly protein PilF
MAQRFSLPPAPNRRAVEFLAALVLVLLLFAPSCSRNPPQGKPETGAQPPTQEDEFARLMNTGKNYLDQNQADRAIECFRQATALGPARTDAHINLANALLLAGQAEDALRSAHTVLDFDRNSAAAAYVAGCAHLRLRQPEDALRQLQSSHDLDPTVAAVSYQIGRAQQELSHFEDAIAAFQETVRIEPDHPVAHYALSQVLVRAGNTADAQKALDEHNRVRAKGTAAPATPEAFERCKHTQARAPQKALKPDPQGVPVTFADATAAAFGSDAARYHAPIAVLDYNRDDRNSLVAAEGTNGFRLLGNNQGAFRPVGAVLPANPGGRYRQILVGDLNNDRFEDLAVLGETASHIYRFATNGAARDVTAAAGLKSLVATDGALVDLDFTGKLDLLAVLPGGKGLRVLRNLGNMYFKDITATSGVPDNVTTARQIAIDDWNNDDLMDVFVTQTTQLPIFLQKLRGGPLVPTNLPPGKLEGTAIALGDLNGDSRTDLVLGAPDHLDLLLGGLNQFIHLPIAIPGLTRIRILDYDNDGWLDLLAAGDRLTLLRNLGDGKFDDVSARTGLSQLPPGAIDDLAIADFDQDGDTDLVLAIAGQGLRLLRNDGGNANHQLKLRLIGNRSNATGLGIRVELTAGSFRVNRTVQGLPVEIGVGKNDKLDSLTARWFDLAFNQIDLKPDPHAALPVFEPVLPTGSCPYLYAWDGQRFRFVTDILGSAPLGLRITDTLFAEADPSEYVWLGDDHAFPPRDNAYSIRITEELREVLYLDTAELVVVDHPADTEVHTTDKFRPGRPFPPGELWTLGHRHPLRQATRLDGSDVTAALDQIDGNKVSPTRLRIPQLRGLAEPHGVVLDFGPLDTNRPLVLALTGWLRFGGGMANVAASHNPDLPFPFPQLEAETTSGQWQTVPITVGAPAGKTKTILVNLAGLLPAGTHRLRLTTAFEIHWDRIALFERLDGSNTRIARLKPDRSDLHWRGFSAFSDLPWTEPLTPDYDRVSPNPPWTITPTGWCTRYGPVNELIDREDNALALLNGGDELTLDFAANRVPQKPPGLRRDFFLFTVGWDKDADFHVELGWQVGPIPWHGLTDQAYGRELRPAFPSDPLQQRYTTRWVGPYTLRRPTPNTARHP